MVMANILTFFFLLKFAETLVASLITSLTLKNHLIFKQYTLFASLFLSDTHFKTKGPTFCFPYFHFISVTHSQLCMRAAHG